MRIAFLVALLAAAVFYSYVAFTDLPFLNRRGRLGSGFFPRILGALGIVMILWAMLDELRGGEISGDGTARGWGDAARIAALAVIYAVLIRLFGAYVSTFLFLLASLMLLEPSRPLRALVVAVAVPVATWLLLDLALNANMPPALIGLPV